MCSEVSLCALLKCNDTLINHCYVNIKRTKTQLHLLERKFGAMIARNTNEYQYLRFNVKILKLMNLWAGPKVGGVLKWKQWRSYSLFIATLPTFLPILIECVLGFYDDDISLIIQMQSFSSAITIYGMLHMAFCFLRHSEQIKEIVNDVDIFKIYSGLDVRKVDRQATLYSKVLVLYTVFGTIFFSSIPVITRNHCEKNKFASMIKHGIPCGVITRFRLPFRYDKSPLYEIFALHAVLVSGTASVLIINTTMLICGLILHVVNQLKQVRRMLMEIAYYSDNEIERAMQFAIKYHIAIIEINEAFGSQLVVFATLSSSALGILGFETLMLTDFAEVLRFGLWLGGVFSIFFLICYFGQLLIDESVGVANDVYSSRWYNTPLKAQKDVKLIIMRAQKPLTLNALNIGTFSAGTFLNVLSSAYSYFTLLLNFK